MEQLNNIYRKLCNKGKVTQFPSGCVQDPPVKYQALQINDMFKNCPYPIKLVYQLTGNIEAGAVPNFR
jgi:hypothetical protein